MSKIWICVESVKPPVWAVRVGNKWYLVKEVKCFIPLESRSFGNQPRMVLCGEGDCTVKNGVAIIGATDKKGLRLFGRLAALALTQKGMHKYARYVTNLCDARDYGEGCFRTKELIRTLSTAHARGKDGEGAT